VARTNAETDDATRWRAMATAPPQLKTAPISPQNKTPHPLSRTRDYAAATDSAGEGGNGAATSTARAARTGSQLSPRHGRSPRAGGTAAASSPFTADGAQAPVVASYGPGGRASAAQQYQKPPRRVGVLEFEADAGRGGGGAPAVFPPSDDEFEEGDDFGLARGELLHGTWSDRYAGGGAAAGSRRRFLGIDVSWLGRLFSRSGGNSSSFRGAGGAAAATDGPSRCCRLSAIAAAVATFVALAVVLLAGGDAAGLFAPAPYYSAGPQNNARLPRVRLPPPPLMAAASSPYCRWDAPKLPGAVRPLRYSLHLSAQLGEPYAVQGILRVAVEAAESTPCVVMHAELDEQEVARAVAGAAAFAGGGKAAAPAASPGRLPTLPPLAKPWRSGKGEQGMRILSARLYFDGDALDEAAEQRAGVGGEAAAAAAPSASAWAFPSPAVTWPAQPPPTFRAGEDYVDGAVYNASSADSDRGGQVAFVFPRAIRSYPPSQRARAGDDGKSLPTAMLELSFNYTLGTGLDGFYRSSWTGKILSELAVERGRWGVLFLPPHYARRSLPRSDP
jgi:hypothetical protein